MTVDDFKLPKDINPRIQQMLAQIVQILNEGLYEQKSFAQPPLASSSGFEGETRNVVTGGVFRAYKYASGFWWYSDATVASGWSKVV